MTRVMRAFTGFLFCIGVLLSWSAVDARELPCAQAFTDFSLPGPGNQGGLYLAPYSLAPTTLYLNFDGAFIFKVNASDAHGNLSFLCGGPLPPFDETAFGQSRHLVLRQIATRVKMLFKDFNLEVVTRRPAAPPYDMALITDDAARCGYPSGLAGIGPIDCFNQLPGELAFIFAEKITDIGLLATVIAHEMGHSYGLLHSSEPCDVMSNSICPGGEKRFLDEQMSLTPDQQGFCGLEHTNSWQLLMDILGPRPVVTDSGPSPADADIPPPIQDSGPPPGDSPPTAITPASGCAAAPMDAARQKELLELDVALRVILFHLLLLMLLPTLRIVHRRNRGD